MKFSEAYRTEMDNITVSETTMNKVYTYLNGEESISKRRYGTKFVRAAVAFACLAILLIAGFYNRSTISTFARTVFGEFIFDIDGHQVEMGETHPVKFKMDTFLAGDVNVIKNEENVDLYWKNYSCLEDLEKESGITMISSELLESSSSEDNYSLLIAPSYCYGHLNSDFVYGEYHVNVDGMFALEGFNQELWGYGTSEDEKYDSVYESPNGIKAYLVKTEFGNKAVFKAGDILYQVNSNAPAKKLKGLIDSFEY